MPDSNVVTLRDRAAKFMRFADTFSNFIAGIGTAKDKATWAQPVNITLDPGQLTALYQGDWLSRKIVDIPAFDTTRAWRKWQADDDQIEKLETLEKKMNLQQQLQSALKKARLYGGAAMVIGVDDGGDWGDELNLDRVGADALKFVHVCTRYMLPAGPMIRDVSSEWFGHPQYYMRSNMILAPPPGGVKPVEQPSEGTKEEATFYIHPSRVVRLLGADYPDPELAPDAWSDSILQSVYEAIRAVGLVNSSLAAAIAEMKIDIIKVSGLSEIMTTTEGTNRAVSRWSNANVAKSVVNALLIDKENEEWERKEVNFTSTHRLMQAFLTVVAGAADIPATRLLGREPSGMSATGESDTRNYYDRLQSDQRMRLTPALAKLDEVIQRSALGKYDDQIHYEWNSLWQMDDKEKAQIALQKAQAFKIDNDSGLFNPDVLRDARFNQVVEDGLYPGIEAAADEHDLEPDEMDYVNEAGLPGQMGFGGGSNLNTGGEQPNMGGGSREFQPRPSTEGNGEGGNQ
jgi:phage-related protein (TIGR01555 family)